jgi:hypothetical protein
LAAVWKQIEPERERGDHEQAGDRNRDRSRVNRKMPGGERNDPQGMCVVDEVDIVRGYGRSRARGCLAWRGTRFVLCLLFILGVPVRCTQAPCLRQFWLPQSSPAVSVLPSAGVHPDQPPFIGGQAMSSNECASVKSS